MARTKDNRFQNLTIDYQKLMNLNVSRRFQLLDTVEGRSLLSSSNFTPVELSDLFPYSPGTDNRYNRKLQSLTTGGWQNRQTDDKGEKLGTGLKRDLGGGGSNPGAVKKLATLTEDQKAVYEELKNGNISVDDPRVAFLKDISIDDLKRAGIDRTRNENGKENYKMTAIDPLEIQRRMTQTERPEGPVKPGYEESGMTAEVIKNYIRQEATKRNIDPEAAVKVAMTEGMGAYQSAVINKRGERERSYGPYQLYMGGGLGNNFRRDTGIDPENDRSARSIKMQIQYALDYAAKTGNWDPWHGVRDNGLPRSMGLSRDSRAIGVSEPTIGTALTEEEAIRQIHSTRQSSLAGSISESGQKQTSQAHAKVGDDGRPLYIAGDSIGVGVGQSVQGARSVAVGGKHFTDRSDDPNGPIAQLNRVPPGSRVQLYIGTNDANSGRLDPATYQKRMEEIKRIADEKGLDVSIHGPHMSTPARNPRITENIPAVNDMLGSAARAHGFRYVDNTSVVADEGDRIHLSGRGYRNLYERGLPPSQTEVRQAQVEQPVPSFPDGGEMSVDSDSLNVYQLDKNKLRRDNMIAFDDQGKPAFTMNSKEEMRFDPNTGNVEVNSGSKGYKNNPNEIGPEPQKSPEVIVQQNNVPEQTQPVNPVMPTYTNTGGEYNSLDDSINATEKVFKSPSFERAVARARFQNAGDNALGGNFDFGAANMV